MIRYLSPEGESWQAMNEAALKAELGVPPPRLHEFHRIARDNAGAWAAVTRLYGIWPTVPNSNTDANFLKVWTRDEILAVDKIDESELDAHLESAASLWKNYTRNNPSAEPPPTPLPPKVTEPAAPVKRKPGRPRKIRPEEPAPPEKSPEKSEPAHVRQVIEHDEDEVQEIGDPKDVATVKEYGFSMAVFSGAMTGEHRECEVKWFASRLRELSKMFAEPMARSLARQALINELLMRRCDDQMTIHLPSSKDFMAVVNTKAMLEDRYQKQWEQLETICPWARAAEGKHTFAGVMSDVIEAAKAWVAHKDNRLVDGVFTALELQIEMRQSLQAPEPHYRPGWVAAVREAMGGLFDPHWKRKLPNHVARMMDEGFREAQTRMQERGETKLVDLEKMDGTGEYPPLVEVPTDVNEEHLIPPIEPVALEDES